MVHWCLGMYSSGSTWTYNVTRQIAASVTSVKPVLLHFVSRAADVALFERLANTAPQPGGAHIVKSHEIDDEDAVTALSLRADAIIVTIRDPRDAVTSLMLYQDFVFDRSLSLVEKSARLCARFTGDPRSLLLRYEEGFADDVTTLDRIAASFHRSLVASDRTRIFASSRRAAVEALIAGLPQQPTSLINVARPDRVLDPVSQWHTHHAGRSGEIGRWRHMLTEAQALEVDRRLGDWMDRFSYHREKVQPRA
jgi:hypothetical protein